MQEQIEKMTEAERLRLDLALVAISRNPEIGGLSKHGAIRGHREDGVRILYVPTALGTLVLVAYVEADQGQREGLSRSMGAPERSLPGLGAPGPGDPDGVQDVFEALLAIFT
ncbi:hypothetical protein OG361_05755 [Streptomyces sp. NBC_00090]|uniref:hypothetical protein n=1 Tax=Streptomyces sp. NBC_00090 TaxID=2903619 RepID=UPI0032537DBB